MRIATALGLALMSVLTPGCSSSSIVSQYAGPPAYQAPTDHAQYRPRPVSRPAPPAVTAKPDMPVALSPEEESARFEAFIDAENNRLARVTTICSRCGNGAVPQPSYVRATGNAFAKDDPNAAGTAAPGPRINQASREQTLPWPYAHTR